MRRFSVPDGAAHAAGFMLLIVCSLVSADESAGWAEVGSVVSQPQVTSFGRDGDRLWIADAAEPLSAIARETTGSTHHAEAIARYNGIEPGESLNEGQLIYVPRELALTAVGRPAVDWQVQEYVLDSNAAESVETPAPKSAAIEPAVRPLQHVSTEDLDMFAGEVDVLGEVSVERVAVGKGSVIRAEVLDGGQLMVIAQAPGSSSLRLWHRDGRQSDYNIRVSESDPETRVRMERMVRMKVRMVEFRKSALGRVGIDWSDSVNGPGFAVAGDAIGNSLYRPAAEGFDSLPNTVDPFSTYFGIASNIASRINMLASNGDAVTLAEPVLTARNGGNASFLAGGEVPYPSVGSNGQTVVQFKEYGIKLDIAPEVDEFSRVRALVKTEISQIDPAVTVDGAPGLLTRKAQTQVNVNSGETIVISGLLSSESSSDVDQIPGIGNLPIIGAFFKSRGSRNSTSELVIFVTPEVIEPSDLRLAQPDQQVYDDTSQRLQEARSSLPLLD